MRDGQPLGDLHPGKVQELLCYLLIYRVRTHSREALASQYWGDSSTALSRKYLRTALWQLRVILGEPETGGLLLIEPDSVRINPDANFSLDVAEFEEAYLSNYPPPGQALNQTQAEYLQKAVELYRGDLMEGCYEDWCLHERERLQSMYLIMLNKLLWLCEAQGDCERGWSYGTLILRHDPACERTHRRLMRLYYGAGDRAGAARQYERCVAALKEELDVQPSRQTAELYAQICADKLQGNVDSSAPESAGPAFSSLSDLFHRLKKIREVLLSLQKQIRHDIHTLDDALDSSPRRAGKSDKRFPA